MRFSAPMVNNTDEIYREWRVGRVKRQSGQVAVIEWIYTHPGVLARV